MSTQHTCSKCNHEVVALYSPITEKYYCSTDCWIDDSNRIEHLEAIYCNDCETELITQNGEVFYDINRKRILCKTCAMTYDHLEPFYGDDDED